LTTIDAVLHALASANTPEELVTLSNQAEAFRIYAKRAKLGMVAQNRCAEVRVRAERKLGEILRKTQRLHGRSSSKNPLPTPSGSPFAKKVSNWLGREMVYPTNVLHFATECGCVGHPAAFPEEVPEFFIKLFTREGNLVCDPFLGSGTTGIVCKRLNRRFIGIDIFEKNMGGRNTDQGGEPGYRRLSMPHRGTVGMPPASSAHRVIRFSYPRDCRATPVQIPGREVRPGGKDHLQFNILIGQSSLPMSAHAAPQTCIVRSRPTDPIQKRIMERFQSTTRPRATGKCIRYSRVSCRFQPRESTLQR
jgi:hypothetical protein